MKINVHRNFMLIAATGLMTAYGSLISSAFAQGAVPGVVAPTETTKRLSAKVIIDPVMMEFFEAPINTRLIEASVTEYAPGNTAQKASYNLNVQVDATAHTVTEISTPINSPETGATRKIYQYSEPARLQSLKCYKGNKNNWVLEKEYLYTYPGMGGNKSLPMRKTQMVTGQDTTAINIRWEDTYVYDSRMRVIQYLTQEQSHTYQYNKEHNLSSEKIIKSGKDWRLMEYVYQYDGTFWIRKDEFETSPGQPRYMKTSTTRKITLQ